jgi:hypothetical protein
MPTAACPGSQGIRLVLRTAIGVALVSADRHQGHRLLGREPSGPSFHVVVGVPRDASAHLGAINRIVETDKAAASTLEIGSEPAPGEDQP